MRTSVPSICTGYGTGTPACHKVVRACHSAAAHAPAATALPWAVFFASARASREFLVLRPSV